MYKKLHSAESASAVRVVRSRSHDHAHVMVVAVAARFSCSACLMTTGVGAAQSARGSRKVPDPSRGDMSCACSDLVVLAPLVAAASTVAATLIGVDTVAGAKTSSTAS